MASPPPSAPKRETKRSCLLHSGPAGVFMLRLPVLLALLAAQHGGAHTLPRARQLPLHHRLLAERPVGVPEQAHLSLGGAPDEMLISWASGAHVDAASVTVTYGKSEAALDTTVYGAREVRTYAQLQTFEPASLLQPVMDEVPLEQDAVAAVELCRLAATPDYQGGAPPSCDAAKLRSAKLQPTFSGVSSNPDHVYTSPYLVTARLQNLLPATTYWYKIDTHPAVRRFHTLPPPAPAAGAFPFAIAMFADVGQTWVSKAVIERLAADDNTTLVLLAGDWSYADGYGPKWDAWERLMEPLASAKPVMGCAGNHELERGEAFVPFTARHPTPFVESKSASPLDFAFRAGPAHILVLNSYAGSRGLTAQADWLHGALSRVDRSATPWVIAVFHAPWYSSNSARTYTRMGEPMRWRLEQALYDAGVDVVLSGHIHAYERSHPVFNRTRAACGPVHLCVGDAGAHGGPMVGWKNPAPAWSAFRQASFGAGKLVLVNETHAKWTWSRVACARTSNASNPAAHWTAEWNARGCHTTDDSSDFSHADSDDAWVLRDTDACNNKLSPHKRGATESKGAPPPSEGVSSGADDDGEEVADDDAAEAPGASESVA